MPFLETNNIRTFYEMVGTGSPLVLIHGASARHEMWNPQINYFSKSYTVIAHDIRGHGESEGSEDKYSCELFADDLHRLLEKLNVKMPVVCGLSLGGMIAQEYAIKYPDNLRGLVLADTAASSALSISDRITKMLYPKWLIKWTIRRLGPEKYAKWAFKFFDMDEKVRDYLISEQLKMKQEYFLRVIDAIYDFKLLDLSSIKVPTIVVLGENERKAVFTHADKMVELISGSKKIIIPSAGHASNLENPDEFNRILENFLEQIF